MRYSDNFFIILPYISKQEIQIHKEFIFLNGVNIKIRPKAITKYYYRMRRKAKHIGESNWISPKGRHITAKQLYTICSTNGEKSKKQTFIDYIKYADSKLHLVDNEADALEVNLNNYREFRNYNKSSS